MNWKQFFAHLAVTAAGVAATAYLNKATKQPGAPAVTAGNIGAEIAVAELQSFAQ